MNEREAGPPPDARGEAGGRQGAAPVGGREPDPDRGPGRAVRTHASFFSGVGGLDMGVERAGWQTVSFSEIDPYASAVLAQRWPGTPNLGDIVQLAGSATGGAVDRDGHGDGAGDDEDAWHRATLWSGGFPCQDLSVAGKRKGMGSGTRSGLAYAFLALAERYRPPVILLENVPGLLSSHKGRDFYALQRAMAELGYVGAFRVLDGQHFGVPQRRRRVFILAFHTSVDPSGVGAAEVLSVGSRCRWHPATGHGPREGTPRGPVGRADIAGTLGANDWKGPGHNRDDNLVPIGPAAHADRNGAPDGLAGRVDHRGGVVQSLDTKQGGPDDNEAQAGHLVVANAVQASAGHHGHSSPRGDGNDNLVVGTLRGHVRPGSNTDHTILSFKATGDPRANEAQYALNGSPHGVMTFAKAARAQTSDGFETWNEAEVSPTLNNFDVGDARATVLAFAQNQRDEVVTSELPNSLSGGGGKPGQGYAAVVGDVGTAGDEDYMLPKGLDSNRYKCCGNGVISNVAEWIGYRLDAWMTEHGL